MRINSKFVGGAKPLNLFFPKYDVIYHLQKRTRSFFKGKNISSTKSAIICLHNLKKYLSGVSFDCFQDVDFASTHLSSNISQSNTSYYNLLTFTCIHPYSLQVWRNFGRVLKFVLNNRLYFSRVWIGR